MTVDPADVEESAHRARADDALATRTVWRWLCENVWRP